MKKNKTYSVLMSVYSKEDPYYLKKVLKVF